MKVVEGTFGEDMVPMGEGLKAITADPFIAEIEEGNFALVIDTEATGLVIISNKEEPGEQYVLLAHAAATVMEDLLHGIDEEWDEGG